MNGYWIAYILEGLAQGRNGPFDGLHMTYPAQKHSVLEADGEEVGTLVFPWRFVDVKTELKAGSCGHG